MSLHLDVQNTTAAIIHESSQIEVFTAGIGLVEKQQVVNWARRDGQAILVPVTSLNYSENSLSTPYAFRLNLDSSSNALG
jgi:hypothetical protein